MRETIETLWRTASPLKRLLIAGVPAIIVALAAGGVIYASFSGGDGGSEKVVLAATKAPTTATPIPPTKPPAPTATATSAPVSAGLQDSGGDSSYDDGGASADYAPYVPPSEPQSGPGPIEGTNWSLTAIPAIGVNASIYSRTVGGDGQMGDPGGPWQVIWYDFAADGWTGLGGYPGQPGSNVVLAGHVDYIHVGAAVFYSIRDLQPGDIVTVNGDTGPVNYAVQWSQWAEPDQDFTAFVSQTGQESVTLVTCIGEFSAGHYGNRFIVRAVRV